MVRGFQSQPLQRRTRRSGRLRTSSRFPVASSCSPGPWCHARFSRRSDFFDAPAPVSPSVSEPSRGRLRLERWIPSRGGGRGGRRGPGEGKDDGRGGCCAEALQSGWFAAVVGDGSDGTVAGRRTDERGGGRRPPPAAAATATVTLASLRVPLSTQSTAPTPLVRAHPKMVGGRWWGRRRQDSRRPGADRCCSGGHRRRPRRCTATAAVAVLHSRR